MRKLAYYVAIIPIICVLFICFSFKSKAYDAIAIQSIEDVLFPLFSIYAEQTAGESGFTIDSLKDSIDEYHAIDNTDISFDYNPVYAYTYDKSFGIGFDPVIGEPNYFPEEVYEANFKAGIVQYILEHGTKMALSELKDNASQAFNEETKQMIDEQVASMYGYNTQAQIDANSFVCYFELGKMQFAYICDEAGNWLSNKAKDILVSIGDLTFGDVQTYKDTAFLRDDFVETVDPLYTKSFSCRSSSNPDHFDSYTVSFSRDVFIYGSSPTGYQTCYGLIETQYFPLLTGTAQDIIYRNGVLSDVYTANLDKSSYGTVNINGKSYTYFSMRFGPVTHLDGHTSGATFSPEVFKATFQTFSTLKTWLEENTDIPGYATPLVDAEGVPYTVPSTHGLASTIDHVYPAIQAQREGVITVPTDDTITKPLVDTLPADIADIIADAIADVIAEAVPFPKVLTDTLDPNPGTDPNPDPEDPDYPPVPPNLPTWFWPTLFPDIIGDNKFFTIFKPIFDIVGTQYSMYDTWIMIPAILLFLLIFYIIISVL